MKNIVVIYSESAFVAVLHSATHRCLVKPVLGTPHYVKCEMTVRKSFREVS